MTLAEVVGVVLFVGVTLYAVFGGADFGSGVWDLTAGSAAKGARTRALVDVAIGPVWEANHVWLISRSSSSGRPSRRRSPPS